MASWIPPLLSTFYRIFAYIFLQLIPTRLAVPVLPFLYVSHLISLLFTSSTPNNVPVDGEHTTPDLQVKETERNGQPISDSTVPKRTSPTLAASLLFSLKTRDRLPNLLNVVINTALFVASLDLALNPVFYPENSVAFARVGAVYPDAAKITVRYPLSESNLTEWELRLLYRKAASSAPWKDGPLVFLREESDWVNTTKISNLWPETVYEYAFSDQDNAVVSPIQRFQTFPDPRFHEGSHFKFLVSSCITPNFPYGGPQNRLKIKGFDRLAEYLKPSKPALILNETVEAVDTTVNATEAEEIVIETPSETEESISGLYKFMLFLGDFIYADVPIYFGDAPDAYLRLYRRNYASQSFRKLYKSLPILFAYDDHEIINNYGGEGVDLAPYHNASLGFSLYNGNSNYDSINPGDHYYNFTYGDTAFFVLDTRRHRSSTDTEPDSRTMLGSTQLEALQNWLSKVNETVTFKFIVSSVPFTSLWQHDALKDSWGGYEVEKATILDAIQTVPNVFILSGDRHEFAAIEFAAPAVNLHVVREFSTSPLNMFYIPFVRTLKMESDVMLEQVRKETKLTDAGPVVEVYSDLVPTERVLKYIQVGNSKWSSIEVDTRNRSRPVLRLEVIIDGEEAYRLETIGTPIKAKQTKSLISVPSGIKHFLGKLGFQSKQWF
ncbi:alkaline phosphatase [Coprinopsis marcescibilis]|uniref:Alkaline phosphatase n=1 Tax=Coprinopsis marcescibilis TaxID=230819 RepID=A0A5C3L0C9_COPMA|nr:alkaline phosphatase [Coprinopsis marcescibilis]